MILLTYKERDKRECKNFWGITTLRSVSVKILPRILGTRIRVHVENTLAKSQYGFREYRSTQDPIFIIRQINKQKQRYTDVLVRSEKERGIQRTWNRGRNEIMMHAMSYVLFGTNRLCDKE